MTNNDCPDPLCILDMTDPHACYLCKQPKPFSDCPRFCEYSPSCQNDPNITDYCPKPKYHPGWGGKREGAGAPRGNLNSIKHGRNSKLIQTAVDKLAADPELRAFLLLIARAALEGELPQTTKNIILKALPSPRREAAVARLRRLRDES